MVDTDRIHSQRLHQIDIQRALGYVNQRIIGCSLICNSWIASELSMSSTLWMFVTFIVELLSVTGEQLGSFCCDSRNSRDGREQQACEKRCRDDHTHDRIGLPGKHLEWYCMESKFERQRLRNP